MYVLLDMSYLAYRATYTLRGLSHDEIPTGVLYGFFEQLHHVCAHPLIASNQLMVFCDSAFSFRKEELPSYKSGRKHDRTEEEKQQISIMYDQVTLLRRTLLPQLGIPVYVQKGLEADDLMMSAAQELTHRKEKGVLVTSDGDLFQAISETVSWFDPQRNLWHTPKSFKDQKGIPPNKWGLVKALGGCSTDDVPGVKGVGEQSAIKYLRGEIPDHHKKFKAIKEAEENGELEKWKSLVVLPHHKTRPVAVVSPAFEKAAFFEMCKEYGIESYLTTHRNKWEAFFQGQFTTVRRRK